jgi:hypothetical protein
VYPLGTFKGYWYSGALYALEMGYVLNLKAMIYRKKHLIFQEYIDDIYKKEH